MDMTDQISSIERHSLEAHVELCARRYSALEDRLDDMAAKIDKVDVAIEEMYDLMMSGDRKRHEQHLKWGVGIITILLGVIGGLIENYATK
jgi:hypothetical protein